MSAITSVSINGVQYSANFEYTSQAVSNQFRNDLQIFTQVYNLQPTATQSVEDQITPAMVSQMQASITDLLNLAQNGIVSNVDPNDPNSPTKKYFLTVEMARDLDLLLNTLKSTGATNPASITLAQLQMWRSMASQSEAIKSIMQSIDDVSGVANRSLQALTELIYVKTGNDIMADNLSSLQDALSTVQASLQTLTDIQNLKNMLTTFNLPAFSVLFDTHADINGKVGQFNRGYNFTASYLFGQPVVPELASTLAVVVQKRNPSTGSVLWFSMGSDNDTKGLVSKQNNAFPNLSVPQPNSNYLPLFSAKPVYPGFTDALYKLLNVRNALQSQMGTLQLTTPNATDPGTLYSRLKTIVSDINKYLVVRTTTISNRISHVISMRMSTIFSTIISHTLVSILSTRMSTRMSGVISVPVSVPFSYLLSTPISYVISTSLSVSTSYPISVPTSVYTFTPITFTTPPADAFTGFRLWMLDNSSNKFGLSNTGADASKAGQIQKDITFAITAAESLNDTQKESVRRYLFLFEEYYKSASAMLNALTQIIQKLADNISKT